MDYILERFYSKNGLYLKIASYLLFILGSMLLLLPLFFTLNQPPTKISPPVEEKTAMVIPSYIEIKGVIEKIPVGLGDFKEGTWEVARDKALYLSISGKINQKGNVVIYGHNTSKVLGNLKKAKKRDEIELTTNSGSTLKYRIYKIKTVSPNQVEILHPTDDEERLTIFTCSGLFDSQRLVVQARRMD